MPSSFYITTAIDYANGSPHLGHAYEKVLSDVISRHMRMSGRKVYFLTGLDEHGQKVQQTALKRGVEPQVLVDEIAAVFKGMLGDLNISNDDYIRTTEPRHKKVVQQFLQQLFDQGLIYKGQKTDWYSTRQEQFLTDKDRADVAVGCEVGVDFYALSFVREAADERRAPAHARVGHHPVERGERERQQRERDEERAASAHEGRQPLAAGQALR